jgi:ketosteroid isomerase-like protein
MAEVGVAVHSLLIGAPCRRTSRRSSNTWTALGEPTVDRFSHVSPTTNDVVVAEGKVRANRTDGTFMSLVFCDVLDMRDGKIQRLISYLMEVK